MPRIIEFEVVTETSHFTALQLQPRTLLSLSFNALSRWLREHLVSFPRLIRDYRCSVVITGVSMEWKEPLSFFDCDALKIRAGLRSVRRGSRIQLDADFYGPKACAASVRVLFCPVEVIDPVSLAAQPKKWTQEILGKFHEDEMDPQVPEMPLPGLIGQIEKRPAFTTHTNFFRVHRHHCEVADQWAFTEVPNLVAGNDEVLALGRGVEIPELRVVLVQPMRNFDMDLTRPYFWLQQGKLKTSAHIWQGRLALIHRLLSPDLGEEEPNGIVVERF